jgi:uncharacterized protein (TIGR00299 family) protein
LAEAEAEVHGIEVEKAAFHELGTVDSIVDVVMAAHCLKKVGADRIYASPVRVGRGLIRIAHGTHAVPPPASARLLVGMQVAAMPAAIGLENVELSTPTGLAILKAASVQFVSQMPPGKLLAIGSGSGTLDLGDFPNIFRVAVLENSAGDALPYEADTVVEIACNIDDDTAEHISWLCTNHLERGALDVWQTPAAGKKGRVAICLSILAAPDKFNELSDWLLRHSTTFGIRYLTWDRLKLQRHYDERQTGGRSVRYKIGTTTAGEKLKEKPEFDDWEKSGR